MLCAGHFGCVFLLLHCICGGVAASILGLYPPFIYNVGISYREAYISIGTNLIGGSRDVASRLAYFDQNIDW